MITCNIFADWKNHLIKRICTSTFYGTLFCAVLSGFIAVPVPAYAEIHTVSGSNNIAYLQTAFYVKSAENALSRYRTAMIVMSQADNREDFMVYRDDINTTRENLSYSIASMQEYEASPLHAQMQDFVEKAKELLRKCEAYATNQNEIIAMETRVHEKLAEVPMFFEKIKQTERELSHKLLTSEQSKLIDSMVITREDYEKLILSFFQAQDSAEIDELVKRLPDDFSAYMRNFEKVVAMEPSLSKLHDDVKKFFNRLFTDRGIGNEYYALVKKKSEQNQVYEYFQKSFRELDRMLQDYNNRIHARLEL